MTAVLTGSEKLCGGRTIQDELWRRGRIFDAKMGVVGTADGENGIGSSMASGRMCVQNEFGEQQGKLTSAASGQDTS